MSSVADGSSPARPAAFRWLGRGVPYAEAHALQRQVLEARIRGEVADTVLLLEHADTITVGKKLGSAGNVLDAGDIPVVTVERGGDVTWHGPGQLVAYPIVGITDLHAHLRALEQAVIDVLADLGLEGVRDPRNSGVWLGGRKVCSVGIACRRWVAWHGLALNVDPDLERFARIRPCGFDASIMTRLADHLDPCPTVEDLVEPLSRALGRALERAT
jgi:lipoyl(octanoyl) transferase